MGIYSESTTGSLFVSAPSVTNPAREAGVEVLRDLEARGELRRVAIDDEGDWLFSAAQDGATGEIRCHPNEPRWRPANDDAC